MLPALAIAACVRAGITDPFAVVSAALGTPDCSMGDPDGFKARLELESELCPDPEPEPGPEPDESPSLEGCWPLEGDWGEEFESPLPDELLSSPPWPLPPLLLEPPPLLFDELEPEVGDGAGAGCVAGG